MDLQYCLVIFSLYLVSSSTQTTLVDKLDTKPATRTLAAIPLEEVGTFNNKKYYTANVEATWSQSLEICHSHGKVAAVLETSQEVTQLGLKLKFYSYYVRNYFWTSAHDLLQEGRFQWLNGNAPVDVKLPVKFQQSMDRNCVQLHFQGYLFDWVCDDKKALPLCQDP